MTIGSEQPQDRRRLDEWAPGEVVRSLERIEASVSSLEARIVDLSNVYVRQDVYKAEAELRDRQHLELAKWTADIAASLERTRREDIENLRTALSDAREEFTKSVGESTAALKENMVTKTVARWLVGTCIAALGVIAAFLAAIGTHATQAHP